MNRILDVTLSTVAVLVVLGAPLVAHALPVNMTVTTFYKDKSFSTEVGMRTLGCDGQQKMTGKTSQFSEKTTSPCNPSSPSPSNGCACTIDGRTATCPPHVCQ